MVSPDTGEWNMSVPVGVSRNSSTPVLDGGAIVSRHEVYDRRNASTPVTPVKAFTTYQLAADDFKPGCCPRGGRVQKRQMNTVTRLEGTTATSLKTVPERDADNRKARRALAQKGGTPGSRNTYEPCGSGAATRPPVSNLEQ